MRSVNDHDIEPGEVMWLLEQHHPRWPRPARDTLLGLGTLTIWGRTSSGRALLVATRRVGARDWEIVGARELTAAEVSELERWEAERER